MKKAFISTLLRLMEKQNNIYVFTGDLGFGVMTPIIERYPSRFFNMGICEQNMASAAAGMSLAGNIVYIYSIGNFPTFRCMEQIRNDITYHNANVKIVAVGSGFSYGSLGMSHHLTEDLGTMRALEHLTILSPGDAQEAAKCVEYANGIDGPVYIRLGRGNEKDIGHKNINITDCRLLKVTAGKEIVVFATGSSVYEAKIASEILKKSGADIGIYSVPVIKPIDTESVLEIVKQAKYVFTVEEHNIIGGLGSAIAEILAENRVSCFFKRIGLEGYSHIVGSLEYLRKQYGLDGESIARQICSIYPITKEL